MHHGRTKLRSYHVLEPNLYVATVFAKKKKLRKADIVANTMNV